MHDLISTLHFVYITFTTQRKQLSVAKSGITDV